MEGILNKMRFNNTTLFQIESLQQGSPTLTQATSSSSFSCARATGENL
jgi:hypothetical protein